MLLNMLTCLSNHETSSSQCTKRNSANTSACISQYICISLSTEANMIRCKWYKGLLHRKIVSLVLFLYFIMIFLFLMNLDVIQSNSKADGSARGVLADTPRAKRNSLKEATSLLRLLKKLSFTKTDLLHHSANDTAAFDRGGKFLETEASGIIHAEVVPMKKPMLDLKYEKAGDFIVIGKEAYVYSAFIDDRKTPSSVRIISLLSMAASTQPIYCLFNDTKDAQPQLAVQYELCENHARTFGGYVFSCRVPHFVDIRALEFVTISFAKPGSNKVIPLLSVRPPEQKIVRLDVFPNRAKADDAVHLGHNSNSSKGRGSNNYSNNIDDQTISQKTFTFAICISPLFGNISVHRLVEFIELSRLLGADHFIFYNHSMTPEISVVLQYYISKNLVWVQSWTLPPQMHDDENNVLIWYYGQLIAHNDCLYRSMPHFDLVAFNDIDEFIVPHSNVTSWREIFPSLLSEDRCGFSFVSAFYDPENRDPFTEGLLTPILTGKMQIYNTVRKKVMLSPWRVFEVGIHHISKQNREEWLPLEVQPEIAYLHHYRRCLEDYGMSCGGWVKDTVIADRYLRDLAINFNRALRDISAFRQASWLSAI